jgi:peptidyl-prolyl cis-trans isomerase C
MPRRSKLRIWLIGGVFAAAATPALSFAQLPSTELTPPGTVPQAAPDSVNRAPVGNGTDPVIGSVDGKLLYLSDLTRVTNTLPEQMRSMPFDSVMPVLLDRIIDHEALTLTARRAGLDRKPEIQREMRAAADLVLERAYLSQIVPAQVTEAAIVAHYNRQYANRPATDEVRARHILVGTEAEAKSVLDELKKGGDFAAIARVVSKDPDGKQGGDLGFFRRDQVWPAFADAAFSLRPGQVGQVPVHNEFGWHVIKVEERRLVAPPTLSEVREQIRQELTDQTVQAAIADSRRQMIIHKFNLDGSEIDASPQLTRAGTDRPQ